MEEVHKFGVDIILYFQHLFEGYDEWMLLVSHLADPRNAFLMFFPIAFFCHKRLGVRVLWGAVLAEWLNALLKWVLHGERPYWWVHETHLYGGRPPELLQTRLTCETGPGSPSGHAMVTSCSLFLMLLSHTQPNNEPDSQANSRHRSVARWVSYAAVLLFLAAAAICRCFISTHFPHQVVAGTIAGYVLAKLINNLPLEKVTCPAYVTIALALLLSGPGVYWTIETMGYDPDWSVNLARKWCARREWVYLDTTLFFAIIRDSASLFGLGLALQLCDVTEWRESDSGAWRLLCAIVSLLLTRGQEYIHIPKQTHQFYSLAFIKYALLPILVMVCLPALVNRFKRTKKIEKNS